MGATSAATKTSSFGNDIVILDASNGRELARLTNDGSSWAPVWSPLGDSIAFLHIAGQIVDLELIRLDGDAPNWTVKDVIPLTAGGRSRRRVAARLVRPRRPAAGSERDACRQRRPELVGRARPVTATYLERLAERTSAVGTVLCLGLDPDPAALPRGFSRDVAGVERFVDLIVEAAGPYAAAIKPNLAFYESLGSAGLAALERIRGRIPAGIPVVIDAKRADIGSTAAHHAVALFDRLGADAVTVNPYPGGEAIAPLFERLDRYAYVLCRTSNPAAAEFQNLIGRRRPDDRRARRAAPPAGRPARRGLGTGWHGRARGRRDRARRAARDPDGRARTRLPRAGHRSAGWRDRARPPRRPGDRDAGRMPGPAADCSSTSRAGSARRRSARRPAACRATPVSVWRRLPATGLGGFLCYPSRRKAAPRASVPAGIDTNARPLSTGAS